MKKNAKALAAIAAAAQEIAAAHPRWPRTDRIVREAVAQLGMRPRGVVAATMSGADVFETLARHGLATEAPGLTFRAGPLTAAAQEFVSEDEREQAADELEDVRH